ncbi:hypothetical protein KR018_009020, partial [Drosophila ironensis]
MENPVGQAETMVANLNLLPEKTCDATMPRRKNSRKNRPPVYWWWDTLRNMRAESHSARRRAQRARERDNHPQLIEQYKLARATLQKEIAKAKAGAFKELLTSIDEDPWGMAYKIVYKRI